MDLFSQVQLTDAGDVAELLLVGEHVAAQSVHYSFNLELLHLVHQGPQTVTINNTHTDLPCSQGAKDCHHKQYKYRFTLFTRGPRLSQ